VLELGRVDWGCEEHRQGQTLLSQGELRTADAELTSATGTARQLGNPPQLWKTLATVGDLRVAQSGVVDARDAYGEALAVVSSVAARLVDERLRQTLLSSALVARIVRRAHGY